MGDGIGGTEKYLGHTSTDIECAYFVRYKEPNANGASWNQKIHSCYAEFGATGHDGRSVYRTCLFTGQLTLLIFMDKYFRLFRNIIILL